VTLKAPSLFPAATDSRWIRQAIGVPCIGFSPIAETPVLLHDHDEFIFRDGFLSGVGVYASLVRELAIRGEGDE
jgi:aminoacylase